MLAEVWWCGRLERDGCEFACCQLSWDCGRCCNSQRRHQASLERAFGVGKQVGIEVDEQRGALSSFAKLFQGKPADPRDIRHRLCCLLQTAPNDLVQVNYVSSPREVIG